MTATITGSGVSFLDVTQTTSNMNTFANHSAGAVGSYGLFVPNGAVAFSGLGGYGAAVGTTVSGSGLYFSNTYGANWNGYTGTSPAGTWKLLGTAKSSDRAWGPTLWVRIS